MNLTKYCLPARRVLGAVLLLVLYLVSTVPVGLALYAAKEKLGWNVFKTAGFHHYLACLGREADAVAAPSPLSK